MSHLCHIESNVMINTLFVFKSDRIEIDSLGLKELIIQLELCNYSTHKNLSCSYFYNRIHTCFVT